MAAPLQPPSDGNVNRAASMIAMWIAEPVIGTIFTSARAYARWKIRKFGSDDYTMFATNLIYLALAVIVCVMAADGGARHAYYLPPKQLEHVTILNFANQAIAALAQGLSKISIALLLLRLFNATTYRARKLVLWFVIGLTAVNAILQVFVTFFQCQNPQALWKPELAKTTKCWNPHTQPNIAIYTSSWNTFVDFFLAFLPLPTIWSLKMPRRRKVAISALLGLGSVSGVFSAIKTAQLSDLASRQDSLWEEYTLYAWVNAELFVILVCGNIAPLKIFFDRYLQRRTSTYLSWPDSGSKPRNTVHSTISARGYRGSRIHSYVKSDESDFVLSGLHNGTHSTDVRRVTPHGKDDLSSLSEEGGVAKTTDDQVDPGYNGIKVSRTFEVV